MQERLGAAVSFLLYNPLTAPGRERALPVQHAKAHPRGIREPDPDGLAPLGMNRGVRGAGYGLLTSLLRRR